MSPCERVGRTERQHRMRTLTRPPGPTAPTRHGPGRAPQRVMRQGGSVGATRRWSGCAVDGNKVVAERHRPAGVVERDRPCPPVTAINVSHPVRMPLIVDDVARLEIVGVDRGHRALPSNRWRPTRCISSAITPQEPERSGQIHGIGLHHRPDTSAIASGRARAPCTMGPFASIGTFSDRQDSPTITTPPSRALPSRSRAATRRRQRPRATHHTAGGALDATSLRNPPSRPQAEPAIAHRIPELNDGFATVRSRPIGMAVSILSWPVRSD